MEILIQNNTPWRPISVKDSDESWLIKFGKTSDGYYIAVTNIKEIYFTTLKEIDIEEKNNEMNPRLKTSVEAIMNHLITSFDQQNNLETMFEFHEKLDCKILSLSNKFSKIFPFKWDFQFSKSGPSTDKNILFCPLVLTVKHLLNENEKLKNIIKTKCPESLDAEQNTVNVTIKSYDAKEKPATVVKEDCKHSAIDKKAMEKFCLESFCSTGFSSKISEALINYQDNKLNPNTSNQSSTSKSNPDSIKKINYAQPLKRKLLEEDSQSFEESKLSSPSKVLNSPKKSKLFQNKKKKKNFLL